MIFKDEKILWYADTEILAKKLEGKTKDEIQEIFDQGNIIKITSIESARDTVFNRLANIIIFPMMLVLFCIKWVTTGDGHLDSWAKKYKIIGYAFKMIGHKQ